MRLADVDVELLGPGQRAAVGPRQRVARLDQVAGEPEASGDQRAADPDGRGLDPVALESDRDHAQREQAEGREQVELGAEGKAGGEGRDDQRSTGEHRRQPGPARVQRAGRVGRGPGLGRAVDEDRGGSQQEEEAGDVVLRVPGLVEQQHLGVEDHGHPQHRGGAGGVRAAEAPGREQAQRHPADVHQRREEIGAEEEDPRRIAGARSSAGRTRRSASAPRSCAGRRPGRPGRTGRRRGRCARSCSAGTCRCRGRSGWASPSGR